MRICVIFLLFLGIMHQQRTNASRSGTEDEVVVTASFVSNVIAVDDNAITAALIEVKKEELKRATDASILENKRIYDTRIELLKKEQDAFREAKLEYDQREWLLAHPEYVAEQERQRKIKQEAEESRKWEESQRRIQENESQMNLKLASEPYDRRLFKERVRLFAGVLGGTAVGLFWFSML